MSYTYPEALDGMQKVATDLLDAYERAAELRALGVNVAVDHATIAGKTYWRVSVVPDAKSGTASVTWDTTHWSGHKTATINMPVLPANYRMSRQEFTNYAGYIFHEIGHPLFTDKRVWQNAVYTGHANLLNALEDVRIEKALIDAKLAANGMKVLCDLCHQLDYTAIQKGFDANEPKFIGFVMGFMGRAANGYDLDVRLLKIDPNGVVGKALVWALPALAACQTTQDCYDLAKRLMKALPKKNPDKPKGKGKGPEGQKGKPEGEGAQEGAEGPQEGEGAQEGQKGEKKGEGAQEGAEGPQEGEGEGAEGEGEGEQSEASVGQTSGQGAGEQPEGLTDKDIKPVNLRPDNGKAVKNKRGFSDADIEAQVIAAIRNNNAMGGKELPKAQPVRNSYRIDQIAAEVAKAARQRALIARALKRNEQDLFEGGLKHGKLDRRAFARLEAGARNVFGRRELEDGYETDVTVLVDGSGSMGEEKIVPAATLALVIAQAASQVGVACSTYIFGTQCSYAYQSARGMHGLVEVKEGKGKPDISKFAEMPEITGGGTPLSGSMLAVAKRQMVRAPNKRRVMFVVSDGMCTNGPDMLKRTASYIETALGTELAHMSIHMALRGCFSNEVEVREGQDVASIGLEALTRKLTVQS